MPTPRPGVEVFRRRGTYPGAVSFRDWLIRRLGGDALVGDPDGVVEAALVQLWESQLVVAALGDEGIRAQAIHDVTGHATQHLRPMARVFVARRNLRRALDVIGKAQRGELGRDMTWPPRHDVPWGPPSADGALP